MRASIGPRANSAEKHSEAAMRGYNNGAAVQVARRPVGAAKYIDLAPRLAERGQRRGRPGRIEMVQQEQVAPPERKPTWTEWAFKNVAGMYSDAGAAAARLRGAAGHGCRIVGGVSVMPLPLGHEVCVTVVPIEQTALYPINPHARALMRGEEAIAKLKKEDRDEMPRWGIGKSIINTLAMAVSVEWL